MKIASLIFCAVASVSFANAKDSITLPKGSFVLKQLAEAKSQATTEKKPIAFVVSSLSEADSRRAEATKECFTAIGKKALVVFVTRDEVNERKISGFPEVPMAAIEKMKHPDLPIVVITDSGVTNTITSVYYNQFVDSENKIHFDTAVDHLKKDLREIK